MNRWKSAIELLSLNRVLQNQHKSKMTLGKSLVNCPEQPNYTKKMAWLPFQKLS